MVSGLGGNTLFPFPFFPSPFPFPSSRERVGILSSLLSIIIIIIIEQRQQHGKRNQAKAFENGSVVCFLLTHSVFSFLVLVFGMGEA